MFQAIAPSTALRSTAKSSTKAFESWPQRRSAAIRLNSQRQCARLHFLPGAVNKPNVDKFEVFRRRVVSDGRRISPLVIVRLAATLRFIVRRTLRPCRIIARERQIPMLLVAGKVNIDHPLRAFVDNLESPLFLIRS